MSVRRYLLTVLLAFGFLVGSLLGVVWLRNHGVIDALVAWLETI